MLKKSQKTYAAGALSAGEGSGTDVGFVKIRAAELEDRGVAGFEVDDGQVNGLQDAGVLGTAGQ